MSDKPQLSPNLWEALYKSWDPARGLSPDALRTLLQRIGCSLGRVAQETGVQEHYVGHVLSRTRRSAKVEACISRHLACLGLTSDVLWGIQAPKRPSMRKVPDGFGGVPAFTGRLIEKHHRVLLLVDCETSGPSASLHRVVEGAFLQVVYDQRMESGYRLLGVLDGYTGLQDPGPNPVNPISMRVHGIPIETLIGQKLDLKRIARLASLSHAIVAHNAEFDHRFLGVAVPELNRLPWMCSFRGVAWKELGFPAGNLRVLAEALGLPRPGHRAPGDLVALYHLLDARLPDGRTTLAHLITSTTASLKR